MRERVEVEYGTWLSTASCMWIALLGEHPVLRQVGAPRLRPFFLSLLVLG